MFDPRIAWLTAFTVVIAPLYWISPAGAAEPGCEGRTGRVIEITLSVVEDGSSGIFVRRVEIGTGRMKEMVRLGALGHGQGFDGTLAWSQDVSGALHDLNSGVSGKPARLVSRADANALFKQPPGTAVTLDVAAPGQQPNTVRLLLRDLL